MVATSTLVLGIDLGNTTCSVALYRNGGFEVVANEQGSRSTPSVVAFTEVEQLLGEPARAQLVRNPANTVVDGLRLCGRLFDDEAFQTELASWRFRVSRGKDGVSPQVEVVLKGEEKAFTPARLLSQLLARLRTDAEAATGELVKEAVVSVPAHFSPSAREALKEAAQIGGLRVKSLLPAPLCVALLHGHHATPLQPPGAMNAEAASEPAAESSGSDTNHGGSTRLYLVVDVGGSSLEASVVEHSLVTAPSSGPGEEGRDGDGSEGDGGGRGGEGAGQSEESYCVLASVAELGHGGRDVDSRLRAHVLKEIKRRQRADLSDNSRAMARLLAACESAKHALAHGAQATVSVEADGVDYFSNVSRAALEELTSSLAAQVMLCQMLPDAARCCYALPCTTTHYHALPHATTPCRMLPCLAACSHARHAQVRQVHFAGALLAPL